MSVLGLMLMAQSLLAVQPVIAPSVLVRKTQALYCENGVGVDFSHSALLNGRLHFNAGYISSRLGSAIGSNALKQDYLLLGADWRTPILEKLGWVVGIGTGVFMVDYEDEVFETLPATSALMAVETGLAYQAGPVALKLMLGYNLISGNGADVPGSLFPVYYQLNVAVPLSIGK